MVCMAGNMVVCSSMMMSGGVKDSRNTHHHHGICSDQRWLPPHFGQFQSAGHYCVNNIYRSLIILNLSVCSSIWCKEICLSYSTSSNCRDNQQQDCDRHLVLRPCNSMLSYTLIPCIQMFLSLLVVSQSMLQ